MIKNNEVVSENELLSLKNNYLQTKNEANNSYTKRSLKEQYYRQKQDVVIKNYEIKIETINNFFSRWMMIFKLFIIRKHLNFIYKTTNALFLRSINKKKVFTVSMAGESLIRKISTNFVKVLFLTLMALIILFPFYWMLSMSFRSSKEINDGLTSSLSLWPTEWSTEAFHFLFNNPKAKISIVDTIGNSFLIAILSTTTQLTVSLFTGYGLSRYNTRGKELLIVLILATMMLPGEALMIGQYRLATQWDMKENIIALIVPFIGNAFTIYMFKNAFDGVNKSIKAAAQIDGLNSFKFFWKVSIPLIKAILFTAFLTSFIGSWNSVLWPTMVLSPNNEHVTLPMLLWQIMQSTGDANSPWSMDMRDAQHLKMAAAIIAVLPMFILFALTKKYLVRGITKNSGSKE